MLNWGKSEISLLKKLYPTTDRKDIEKSLPNRTWVSIKSKAERLAISRHHQEKTIETDDNESKILYEEILKRIERKPINIHNYFPKNHVKIGLMGDTQLGSLYERLDFLEALYKIYKKEGVEHVYHSGDLLDGENIYKGQVYEIAHHGVDSQLRHCKEVYPNINNITTHFITGNHDLSFHKRAGVDIGTYLDKEEKNGRKDFDYMGREEADVSIQGVTLRIAHPGRGTAYALSYKPQKYVESLTGGEKPQIIAMGHYHKAEYIPLLRNIIVVQTGTLQSQTSFMRRTNIAAHLGGWILEFWVDKRQVIKTRAEFIPFFEK